MRLNTLSLALAAASLAACARPGPEYLPEGSDLPANLNGGPGGLWLNRIPPVAFEALRGPHARSFELTVAADGLITRYTVLVGREGVPEWTHKSADDILGRGEDVGYEAVVRQDGTEAYGITRMIGGKRWGLSVRADGSLQYREREIEAKELPPSVAAALPAVSGFAPERYAVRESPRLMEYHVWGKRGDTPLHVRLGRDGRILATDKVLRAEVAQILRE